MIESTLGDRVLSAFVEDLESGAYTLDCCLEDTSEMGRLVERYRDMRLGLADAYVAACACRNGKRVMTFDRRHLEPVGRELGLTILPP